VPCGILGVGDRADFATSLLLREITSKQIYNIFSNWGLQAKKYKRTGNGGEGRC
jgi:hypothetical protein